MSLIRLYSTAKLSAFVALGSLVFCILVVCSHLGSMALPTPAHNSAHTSAHNSAHTSAPAAQTVQPPQHEGHQHHVEANVVADAHAGHGMQDLSGVGHGQAEHDCCGQGDADHSLVKWVASVLLLLAVAGLVWAATPLLTVLAKSRSSWALYLKPDPPGGYPPIYMQVQRLRH